jgi:hypothetical protein
VPPAEFPEYEAPTLKPKIEFEVYREELLAQLDEIQQ